MFGELHALAPRVCCGKDAIVIHQLDNECDIGAAVKARSFGPQRA
jgi:hypothetical protein